MHRICHVLAGLFIAASLICGGAHAAVNDSAANGFSVTQTVHIAAPPAKVWAVLVTPSQWWSGVHSFSKDAANLTLDPRAGGCWCEKLPDGGSAQHLVVFAIMPGKALVLRGALGPMQGLGVDGALSIALKPAGDGTDVTATYNVGGYLAGGLASFAVPVDGVLGEQFVRLKARIETGSPDVK